MDADAQNSREFAAHYGLKAVEDLGEVARIDAWLRQFINAQHKFNFGPLTCGDNALYIGPDGFQASLRDEDGRLEHDLIAQMRNDGAEHVYIVYWNPAETLTALNVYEVPPDYDRPQYDKVFDILNYSLYGILLDSDMRFCCMQVWEAVFLFWGPTKSVDRLIGSWHWDEYHNKVAQIDKYDFEDQAFCKAWPEVAVERDALLAVDQYWQETGFTPPPRSKLFKR
ncbi:MAG: hypothetical protein ACPG06_07575 [Alphaproteobacteria bacterium]